MQFGEPGVGASQGPNPRNRNLGPGSAETTRVNLRERLCCVFPSRSRLCLVMSGGSVTGRLGTQTRRFCFSLFFFFFVEAGAPR